MLAGVAAPTCVETLFGVEVAKAKVINSIEVGWCRRVLTGCLFDPPENTVCIRCYELSDFTSVKDL